METTNTLRQLEAKDVAPVASILTKVGMKEIKACFNPEDLQALMSEKSTEEAASAVGLAVMFDIAGVILANYEKAQTEIFKFLASLSGKDIKEIESLPLDTFAEMVIEVVKKEEFKSFFLVVSKLFK